MTHVHIVLYMPPKLCLHLYIQCMFIFRLQLGNLGFVSGINCLFVFRVSETLKLTDPDLIQMDEFKNEQLLSITINLLLFIRSQVPVTKKLFQSCEFTQKKKSKKTQTCEVSLAPSYVRGYSCNT